MNKSEFVDFIAEANSCSKVEATNALDMVTESIVRAVGTGNDLALIGFGSFYVQDRKAREGRNPKTGETMQIKAYKQPAFKAGKKLKDACN
jgi:nucleoid DNA-binding protein